MSKNTILYTLFVYIVLTNNTARFVIPEDEEREENDANKNEIQSRFARPMVRNVVQTLIHPTTQSAKFTAFFQIRHQPNLLASTTSNNR